MIITFLGHSSLYDVGNLPERVRKSILENTKQHESTTFYCGGYGTFDELCVRICRSLKAEYPAWQTVFVTPYITESQQNKLKYLTNSTLYDSTLYPPLETVPPRFAILARNRWMVDQADLIIAYVDHPYGGAYKALEYAKKKQKNIINLAEQT